MGELPHAFWRWVTVHGVVTATALVVYAVTSRALPRRRKPDAAIAWVLFLLLAPYVAFPAFLLFGSRKRALLVNAPGFAFPPSSTSHWVTRTTIALEQHPPSPFDDFELDRDGAAALARLGAVLDGAERTLDVCTFILGKDEVGQDVIERLTRKAQQGVRVRLLLDDLGSFLAGRPRLGALRAAGVEVRLFAPPWRLLRGAGTNLRDHRKLVIADAGLPSARVWSGGRNLASEYFVGDERKAAFRDLSFSFGGRLAERAGELFEQDYRSTIEPGTRAPTPLRPAPYDFQAPAAPSAQLIVSGPDREDDAIHALLVSAAYRAERRIALLTPYFVPDTTLLDALCLAARRGVVVRLLVPAVSNHRMSDIARRRALRQLVLAGARVELCPVMHHGKLVLVDDELALAGSANLDRRSFFLNYELMFAFSTRPEIDAFSTWFEREREDATEYVADRPSLLQDIAEGLVLWTVFQL